MLAPYELRLKKEAKFDCHVVALDQLAKQPLADYAAVCLVDPAPLADDAWQQLADYAAGGGGVAIFLGRNARPIEAFASPAAQQVLPGKLVRQWRAGDRDVYLAPEQLEHPLLAKFRPLESCDPLGRLSRLHPLATRAAGRGSRRGDRFLQHAAGADRAADWPRPRPDDDDPGLRFGQRSERLEPLAHRRRALAVCRAGQRDDVLLDQRQPLEVELSGG